MDRSCISLARFATAIATVALFCSACGITPSSGWTPFQYSLYSPAQLFSYEVGVRGLRINDLYGENASVYGIDVGSVGSADSMVGLQANFIRNDADLASGLQVAAMGNESQEHVRGLQVAGVANLSEDVTGLQLAGVHNQAENVAGVQLAGIVNDAQEVRGVQLAVLNFNKKLVGVQIGGFINRADEVFGLQLGVLNFNRNGPFPVFPIFNLGFASAPDEDGGSEEVELED